MHRFFYLVMLMVGVIFFNSNLCGAEKKQSVNIKNRQRRIFHYLNAKYPEDMQRIKKLMKNDPKKAYEALKSLSDKGLVELKKEQAEWTRLIKEYQTTKNSKVLGKIKAKMVADYDRKIKYEERALANIEDGLIIARMSLKKMKANKNRVIAAKLNKIKQLNAKK